MTFFLYYSISPHLDKAQFFKLVTYLLILILSPDIFLPSCHLHIWWPWTLTLHPRHWQEFETDHSKELCVSACSSPVLMVGIDLLISISGARLSISYRTSSSHLCSFTLPYSFPQRNQRGWCKMDHRKPDTLSWLPQITLSNYSEIRLVWFYILLECPCFNQMEEILFLCK